MVAAFGLLGGGSTLLGCASSTTDPVSPGDEAKQAVEKKINGSWRVTSYVPATTLSQVLMLGLRSDKLMVVFENGRVRSLTPGLTLDRKYRVADPAAETFKVFIADEAGVEVESWCKFDQTGRIIFETKTPPWTGQGTLKRQGPPSPTDAP